MKIRAFAIALLGLSLLGFALLPLSAAAAGRLQETETPPPTVESCLTLPPDEQSDCFATKAAIGELQRQTQEVLGVTATAEAIERDIQGTLQAGQSTPTPEPTEAAPTPTPEGISLPVPGLNVRLNLISLIGLGVCALGGIVLIVLGVYLVRGSNRDDDEPAPVPLVPRADGEPEPEVRPLVSEPAAPAMPAMPAAPSSAPPPMAPLVIGPAPSLDTTLADHRLQGAAAPGTLAVLVSSDGHQVRVSTGDFSIGRAFENDFVVDARFPGYENVSAEHARLVQDSSQRWLIEDLGSANGTTVNGRPTSMNVLRDGWRISFGPVEFTFRLLPSEESR